MACECGHSEEEHPKGLGCEETITVGNDDGSGGSHEEYCPCVAFDDEGDEDE